MKAKDNRDIDLIDKQRHCTQWVYTTVIAGLITLMSGCATVVRVTTWPFDPRPFTYVVDLDEGCTMALGSRVYRSFDEPTLRVIEADSDYGAVVGIGCNQSSDISAGVQIWLKTLELTESQFLGGGPRIFELDPDSSQSTHDLGISLGFSYVPARTSEGSGVNCDTVNTMNSGVAGLFLGENGRTFVFTGLASRYCVGWFNRPGGWRNFF